MGLIQNAGNRTLFYPSRTSFVFFFLVFFPLALFKAQNEASHQCAGYLRCVKRSRSPLGSVSICVLSVRIEHRRPCVNTPSMAEEGNLSPLIKWFEENSKPLTDREIGDIKSKFEQLEFELEDVNAAEDDDLKDLCPDGWSLTRKWALKQALKDYRGMPYTVSKT